MSIFDLFSSNKTSANSDHKDDIKPELNVHKNRMINEKKFIVEIINKLDNLNKELDIIAIPNAKDWSIVTQEALKKAANAKLLADIISSGKKQTSFAEEFLKNIKEATNKGYCTSVSYLDTGHHAIKKEDYVDSNPYNYRRNRSIKNYYIDLYSQLNLYLVLLKFLKEGYTITYNRCQSYLYFCLDPNQPDFMQLSKDNLANYKDSVYVSECMFPFMKSGAKALLKEFPSLISEDDAKEFFMDIFGDDDKCLSK